MNKKTVLMFFTIVSLLFLVLFRITYDLGKLDGCELQWFRDTMAVNRILKQHGSLIILNECKTPRYLP